MGQLWDIGSSRSQHGEAAGPWVGPDVLRLADWSELDLWTCGLRCFVFLMLLARSFCQSLAQFVLSFWSSRSFFLIGAAPIAEPRVARHARRFA